MKRASKAKVAAEEGGEAVFSELDARTSLQLILAVGRAFKFVDDRVRPPMAKLGLTMTEFSVLATLYHRGPIPLGELSQKILLTGASTTYTVKKLELRGLLERRHRQEDQRVILGSITDRGRTLMQEIFPKHARDLASATRALSSAEKQTVTALLSKLK